MTAVLLPAAPIGIALILIAILLVWAIVVLVVLPRHRASAGQSNLPRSIRSTDPEDNDEQRKVS